MRRTTLPAFCAIAAAFAWGCGRGPKTSASEVRIESVSALPTSPDDAAWERVILHPAQLIPQDLVEPRKLVAGATTEVDVQAVTDGTRVAFRLRWKDGTSDDTRAPATFSDACAVQVPSVTSADVPAPQMGEAHRGVEITYWSAAAQAAVDGRPNDIKSLHPNAQIDHYPFESPAIAQGSPEQAAMAAAYAPAHAVGNPYSATDRAVEDLVAEGPGTLSAAGASASEGKGQRTPTGWSVVIVRPLPSGLRPGGSSQIAFAVWNGSEQDAGSRKMRTGWVPLALPGNPG